MSYKDKDKQRAANKAAAKRRRDKVKGMTGMTPKGMTNEGMTQGVTMSEFHAKCAASDEMQSAKDDVIIKAFEPPDVAGLSRRELESAIKAYAQDVWVNSPEYKELVTRLLRMSI